MCKKIEGLPGVFSLFQTRMLILNTRIMEVRIVAFIVCSAFMYELKVHSHWHLASYLTSPFTCICNANTKNLFTYDPSLYINRF
ncbi:uncharacterized protein J3R85_001718 [Psidium guajava]|nr:uncharacterized protein J3R85_001718 [Psidium guajava]